jgi:mono/diheme cytochrome c family protein
MRVLSVCQLLVVFFSAAAFGDDAVDPDPLYQTCAICHRPDGAGVPGTFPPLGMQLAEFARTEAGRDYLIMVPTRGVMGPLEVAGQRINGFMPPQPMSEEELARLLNYVIEYVVRDFGGSAAFTASEVLAARSRHQALSASSVLALRPVVDEGGAK